MALSIIVKNSKSSFGVSSSPLFACKTAIYPFLGFHTLTDSNLALSLATLCIFIRSIFRVAELSGGFKGSLANNEVSFMILDGTMVIIACITLTVMHPGFAFGAVWQEANFTFRVKKKKREIGTELEVGSNEVSDRLEAKGLDMKAVDV
jgi:hypothetical protein